MTITKTRKTPTNREMLYTAIDQDLKALPTIQEFGVSEIATEFLTDMARLEAIIRPVSCMLGAWNKNSMDVISNRINSWLTQLNKFGTIFKTPGNTRGLAFTYVNIGLRNTQHNKLFRASDMGTFIKIFTDTESITTYVQDDKPIIHFVKWGA